MDPPEANRVTIVNEVPGFIVTLYRRHGHSFPHGMNYSVRRGFGNEESKTQ